MKAPIPILVTALFVAGCNSATTTASPPAPASPDELRARQMCIDAADGYKGLDAGYEGFLQSCQIQRLREIRIGIK